MAIRTQTVPDLYPMVRKISRLVGRYQTLRRPEYLLLKVADFGHFASAFRLYEKEMKNVQPKDPGGSHPEDLSSGQKRQGKDDPLGQPGDRRGAAKGRRAGRPRNKRKKL